MSDLNTFDDDITKEIKNSFHDLYEEIHNIDFKILNDRYINNIVDVGNYFYLNLLENSFFFNVIQCYIFEFLNVLSFSIYENTSLPKKTVVKLLCILLNEEIPPEIIKYDWNSNSKILSFFFLCLIRLNDLYQTKKFTEKYILLLDKTEIFLSKLNVSTGSFNKYKYNCLRLNEKIVLSNFHDSLNDKLDLSYFALKKDNIVLISVDKLYEFYPEYKPHSVVDGGYFIEQEYDKETDTYNLILFNECAYECCYGPYDYIDIMKVEEDYFKVIPSAYHDNVLNDHFFYLPKNNLMCCIVPSLEYIYLKYNIESLVEQSKSVLWSTYKNDTNYSFKDDFNELNGDNLDEDFFDDDLFDDDDFLDDIETTVNTKSVDDSTISDSSKETPQIDKVEEYYKVFIEDNNYEILHKSVFSGKYGYINLSNYDYLIKKSIKDYLDFCTEKSDYIPNGVISKTKFIDNLNKAYNKYISFNVDKSKPLSSQISYNFGLLPYSDRMLLIQVLLDQISRIENYIKSFGWEKVVNMNPIYCEINPLKIITKKLESEFI